MIVVRYKPAYAVTFNNEVIGYVDNKDEFQAKIENDILKTDDEKVAFVALDNVDFTFQFVSNNMTNEDEILSELKASSKNIYRVYEVSEVVEQEEVANNVDVTEDLKEIVEEQASLYFSSLEEANQYVEEIKQNYDKLDTNLSITTLFIEEEVTDEAIQEAKAKITEKLDEELREKEEQERIESQTVNGIYLAYLPVTGGNITSRFGVNESVRDHTHGGLDIAAPYGTDIKAAAGGTIKCASYTGGYGNLIIIDHGNGVETYYGHCSKLYAAVGSTVEAGEVIAAVGSTGNSTGNHCHFEVRIDGERVNPQNYLYK